MSEDNNVPFAVGAAVVHKTGGPKMIFVSQDAEGLAICNWMVAGEKRSSKFSFAELEAYKEPTVHRTKPQFF